MPLMAMIAGFGLLVGFLIGAIGIGGVLLVPAMTYIGGIEIRTAIAAAIFGYIFTGAVGTVIYARKGSIRWSMALWICGGAMPGAFLGAYATSILPTAGIELAIAGFILFAGVNALRKTADDDSGGAVLGGLALLAIGVGTGVASAITGTGGPLVLVPALLWLRFAPRTAVGLAQAVQVPIGVLATAGNLVYGQFDLTIGIAVAVGLAIGSALGAVATHYVSQKVLRTAVAATLVAVGCYMTGRALLAAVSLLS